MPQVGKKHYKYTKEGMAKAKKEAAKADGEEEDDPFKEIGLDKPSKDKSEGSVDSDSIEISSDDEDLMEVLKEEAEKSEKKPKKKSASA